MSRYFHFLALMLSISFAFPAIVILTPSDASAQDLVRPGKRRPGGQGKVRPPRRGGRRGKRVRKNRPTTPDKAAAKTANAEAARNRVLIERYLNILETRPGEQFALTRLLELYRLEHGSLAPLFQRFEQRVTDDAQAYSARMILGELYRRGGRAEEGLRYLREAAEIRSNEAAPQLAIARAATELGEGEAARAALEAALRLSRGQDRQEVLRALRDMLLEQDDLEAARERHHELVRASANSLYVRLELGQALAGLDRHREAVEELERVMRLVRGDPRARVPVLREIARSQVALGSDEEALATLRNAMRLTQSGSGERAELLELMVEVYRRRDGLRELVDLLENESGSGFERAELIARLCDELAMATRAERWYRTALRLNARHVDTRVRLIRLLTRLGRVEEATREYETLVRHAPREPRFVTELAEMYLRIGQRSRALQLLARTSRSNPSDVALHSALLNLYGHWGEDALAFEEARILTRIDPRDERHLVELGERYFQAGDQERALATWRRIPTVASERWRGLSSLADVYADHEMGREATELYEEALRLRPDEIGVLRRLANHLERMRRWEDAIGRWQRIIEVSSEQDMAARREARTRIVTIWANQRRLRQHLPSLRRRFGASSPDVEAGRFLYESLERLGQLRPASEVMRRVIGLRVGDVEARLALERVLVRQGELTDAMEVLRELLELAPRRSREFYQRLSSYAMQLQREGEALEFAAQALALNPDDAQGHHRLAQLHRQQGHGERAIAEFRRAIELNDRLYEAYLELAELHETRSQTQEAIRVYLRLLAKAPDDALVLRAGRQALLLAVMESSLARLEHDLLPLALAHTERVVYRRILIALYGNLTWSLIQASAHGEEAEIQAAQERLEEIGRRSLQPLLDALLDIDPEQQEAAVSMLGHLGNPSAAIPLVAFATSDASPSIRARALIAAGQIGDERVVASLIEILDGTGTVALREAAAFGLGRIATTQAITALTRHLDSPVASIRALACVGIGRSNEGRHLNRLLHKLRADDSPLVRAAAAWSLGFVASDEATINLVHALRSGSPLVRRAAVWALGARDDQSGREDVAQALFDEHIEIRTAAAWALRRAGSGSLELQDSQVYHRMPSGSLSISAYLDDLLRFSLDEGSALSALTHSATPIATALETALGGGRHLRRERVIVALRSLEISEDGQILLRPLISPEEAANEDIQEALQPMVSVVVRRATALLQHRDREIRSLAIGVLGQAGGSSVIPLLLGSLADEDQLVRNIAMEHLGRLGDRRAVEPLSQLLTTDRWSLRSRVVQTLGQIPSSEGASILNRVLREDSSAAVRVEAAKALSHHGRDVENVLRQAALNDENSQVRMAACRGLANLGFEATPECGRSPSSE